MKVNYQKSGSRQHLQRVVTFFSLKRLRPCCFVLASVFVSRPKPDDVSLSWNKSLKNCFNVSWWWHALQLFVFSFCFPAGRRYKCQRRKSFKGLNRVCGFSCGNCATLSVRLDQAFIMNSWDGRESATIPWNEFIRSAWSFQNDLNLVVA